jgi:hypothetical protein
MNCPICQKAGISEDAQICPQCNSDLSQLSLLNKLENKIKLSAKRKFVLLIGSGIVIFALVSILYFFKVKFNETISKSPNKIFEIDSLQYYKSKYISYMQIVDSLQNVQKGKWFVSYKVRNGDTLSKIALIFYNDTKLAKKLAEDNHLTDINFLAVNQTLRIEIIM